MSISVLLHNQVVPPQIKAEAKVVMERINKITDEYGNIISEAVPGLEDPPPVADEPASGPGGGRSRKKPELEAKPKVPIWRYQLRYE